MQQPGGDADTASQGGAVENDTTPLHRPGATQRGLDQNPFFGRVLYTYGAVLDQPLSLTRVSYADSGGGAAVIGPQPWIVWAPFSILPLWNYLGEVDRSLIGAGAAYCTTVNGIQRCVLGAWPFAWSALHGVPAFTPYFWHGTVTEGKRDKAQTLYRRYRVYDPITGRFTQEDPIGLAGGLNLYGFAQGDPVSFSDPFGLCPWCPAVIYALRAAAIGFGVFGTTRIVINKVNDRPLGEGVQADAYRGALLGFGMGAATAPGGVLASGTGGIATTVSTATAGGLPVAASAVPKLGSLAQRFGTTVDGLVTTARTTGERFADMAHGGNINALIPRLDGASGFIRVTLDPTGQQVISAGLMRANQVTNGVASGRFVPLP